MVVAIMMIVASSCMILSMSHKTRTLKPTFGYGRLKFFWFIDYIDLCKEYTRLTGRRSLPILTYVVGLSGIIMLIGCALYVSSLVE